MSGLHLPDPPLGDGVVRLRPWRVEDASVLAAAWADPEILRWCAVPPRRDEASARRWIRGAPRRLRDGRSVDLVVVEVARDEVVGEVGLVPVAPGVAEVGYWLLPGARGRGLAGAALRLFAGWALGQAGLGELRAVVQEANPASGRVAQAAGFEVLRADPAGTAVYRRGAR